jgi:hypothetical protein
MYATQNIYTAPLCCCAYSSQIFAIHTRKTPLHASVDLHALADKVRYYTPAHASYRYIDMHVQHKNSFSHDT